jgi:regulator of sigma E protease
VPDLLTFIVFGFPLLGSIVFVHELGHFLAARIVGVRVEIFSLGFGRRLGGFVRGGTDYRVSLLPLGGYVKMAGDNLEDRRAGTKEEFLSRPWYDRVFIAIAGPLANFIMAIVCGILLFALGVEHALQPNVVGRIAEEAPINATGLQQGDRVDRVDGTETPYWYDVVDALARADDEHREASLAITRGDSSLSLALPATHLAGALETLVPEIPAVVGELTVGMPAYQAGLAEGDRIVSIDGVAIRDWWDLLREVSAKPGREIVLVFERGGQRVQRSLTPVSDEGSGKIGIAQVSYGTRVARFSILESVQRGTGSAVRLAGLVIGQLPKLPAMLFKPQELGSNLAGPIAIIQMSADQVERGRTELLNWLMFVSIALMTMNLLPIPVLDGGHILVALIEALARKPLAPKVHLAITRVGMWFLALLMTFAIANDGLKLVQRKKAERDVPAVETPVGAPSRSGAGQ